MPETRVGVSVILTKGDFILMGKRKGSHGAGKWAFPGGHLEFAETERNCAIREVMEETGLDISKIHECDIGVTNDYFEEENKHYITIFLEFELPENFEEPRNMEPNKCEGWEWINRDNFPLKCDLFLPIINLFKKYDI